MFEEKEEKQRLEEMSRHINKDNEQIKLKLVKLFA